MISRDEAIELVRNSSKFPHLLMAAAMMKKLAERFSENGKEWELTGLLHDLDIDDTKNQMSKHGVIATERLEGKLPEICLHAVRAHDFRTGVIPMSKLDKALIAIDSVAILVERMKESFQKLSTEALKTEMEDTSHEQPWHKDNILKCREVGIRLDEFLNICLEAIRS